MTDKIVQLQARLEELGDSDDDRRERVNVLVDLSSEYAQDSPRLALDAALQAQQSATELKYDEGVGRSLGHAGFAYYLMSDHDKALESTLKAIIVLENTGDHANYARALGVLASVHISLGNYDEAFVTAFKALGIHRELGDRYSEGWVLHGLGQGYADFGDYSKAIETCENALGIFRDLGHPIGTARALNGLGSVYQAMGEYDRAEQYHLESLETFNKQQNTLHEARALNDLGLIHQTQARYDKALECHTRALELRQKFGNRQAVSTSLINLGRLYTETNDLDKAFNVLHRALTIAMEIRAKPRIYQANLALSEAYSRRGSFSDALDHYKIYQQIKEEVQGDQASSRIKNLQIAYETEQSKKEAEISRLKNVELREKNEQLRSLLQELKETQTQLVQTEKMAALGKLIAGVVHEINNPIGAITSATDVSQRCVTRVNEVIDNGRSVEDIKQSPRLQSALRTIESDLRVTVEASSRIAKIIRSLKSFIHLDEAKFQDVDINAGLDNTLTLLDHDFKDRIEVVRELGDIPRVAGFPGELNQVFMNLLTNAGEAIDGTGTITVRTRSDSSGVAVDISDTGFGIPSELMQGLFDPTISKKGARVKAGLGLFTAFNIMHKHRGDIKVASEVGKGTTFTLLFP